MRAAIGTMVHFSNGGEHYAAVVTAVHTPTVVNLAVFAYHGQAVAIKTAIEYNKEVLINQTWHWPESE